MKRKTFANMFKKVLFSHRGLINNASRRSLFFSPHPDDETLGCGGTIAKKCKAGEHVKIILMTDGSRSHPDLIDENTLRDLRRSEFITATDVLGVAKNNLVMLNYQDGNLALSKSNAVDVVVKILNENNPDQIFIPYIGETPEDHYTTTEIVLSAIKQTKGTYEIYEYPIWYWHQWPYSSYKFRGYKKLPGQIFNILFHNIKMLINFRISNNISDCISIKENALKQYKSQMTRLIDDEKWQTLVDVSNGDFINCFKSDYEIFRKTNINNI